MRLFFLLGANSFLQHFYLDLHPSANDPDVIVANLFRGSNSQNTVTIFEIKINGQMRKPFQKQCLECIGLPLIA